MGNRLQLQTDLETLISSKNVYYQPPVGMEINYPCIVYNRSNITPFYANDRPYSLFNGYTVTVIDSDPDSEIPEKVASLQRCTFNRHFTSDGLNHDVFILYY